MPQNSSLESSSWNKLFSGPVTQHICHSATTRVFGSHREVNPAVWEILRYGPRVRLPHSHPSPVPFSSDGAQSEPLCIPPKDSTYAKESICGLRLRRQCITSCSDAFKIHLGHVGTQPLFSTRSQIVHHDMQAFR